MNELPPHETLEWVLRFEGLIGPWEPCWELHVGVRTAEGGYSMPRVGSGHLSRPSARAMCGVEVGYAVAFRRLVDLKEPGTIETLQGLLERLRGQDPPPTIDLSPIERALSS